MIALTWKCFSMISKPLLSKQDIGLRLSFHSNVQKLLIQIEAMQNGKTPGPGGYPIEGVFKVGAVAPWGAVTHAQGCRGMAQDLII